MEILGVALDHILVRHRGRFVFDDLDWAVWEDQILRERAQRHFDEKDEYALRKMLIQLIRVFFEVEDESGFSDYLFQKTGYRIKPIPAEQMSISNRRRLHIGVSGSGDKALTHIQILLPTRSGAIYCIRGDYPDIKAVWKEPHVIEIEVPAIAEEFERVRRIQYEGEIINVLYRDPRDKRGNG